MGIFGINKQKQNVAYYIFRKFDPKEYKTVEFTLTDTVPRVVEFSIRGMSDTPSPYTANSQTIKFQETLSNVSIQYFGANLNGIKGVTISPPPSK